MSDERARFEKWRGDFKEQTWKSNASDLWLAWQAALHPSEAAPSNAVGEDSAVPVSRDTAACLFVRPSALAVRELARGLDALANHFLQGMDSLLRQSATVLRAQLAEIQQLRAAAPVLNAGTEIQGDSAKHPGDTAACSEVKLLETVDAFIADPMHGPVSRSSILLLAAIRAVRAASGVELPVPLWRKLGEALAETQRPPEHLCRVRAQEIAALQPATGDAPALTDEQIEDIWYDSPLSNDGSTRSVIDFARAIEAAHGIIPGDPAKPLSEAPACSTDALVDLLKRARQVIADMSIGHPRTLYPLLLQDIDAALAETQRPQSQAGQDHQTESRAPSGDAPALIQRLMSLRVILYEARGFAPAVRNEAVKLVNDTLVALQPATLNANSGSEDLAVQPSDTAALPTDLSDFDPTESALRKAKELRDAAGALSRETAPCLPEVRLNDDASLDEVVGAGDFHLEQMDTNHWWLEISNAAGRVAVWLRAKGKITAAFEQTRSGSAKAARQDVPESPGVRAALQELVEVEDLMGRISQYPRLGRGDAEEWAMFDEYKRRKPIALANARAALSASQGSQQCE